MIGWYDWAGGREAMLRFGPDTGPVVLAAPALFEEANRTRVFLVRILRLLADHGVASALPDLPGQGESSISTEEVSLCHWRSAFQAAASTIARPVVVVALRGGALVEPGATARGRYHVSPVSGASLVRDLVLARLAATHEGVARFDPAEIDRAGPPLLLAGNRIPRELLRDLRQAEPGRADRTVRLATDSADADRKLPGRPLWRASEPDTDEQLAAALADDIAAWARRCVA